MNHTILQPPSATELRSDFEQLELVLRRFRQRESQRTRGEGNRAAVLDILGRFLVWLAAWVGVFAAPTWLAPAIAAIAAVATISLFGSWFHELRHRNVRLPGRMGAVACYAISAPLAVSHTWWDEKHNRGHHRCPGSPEDPDIQFGWFARVIEAHPWRPAHRFQKHSFWALAPLATANMVIRNDLALFRRSVPSRRTLSLSRYVLEKYVPFVALWGVVILARGALIGGAVIVVFFLTSGLIAAVVTQVQHNAAPPLPEALSREFALSRQLLGTADVSGFIWWWISGGTTLHVAHHLAPQLTFLECRGATRRLNDDLRACGLSVTTFPSMRSAVRSHRKRLDDLSRPY